MASLRLHETGVNLSRVDVLSRNFFVALLVSGLPMLLAGCGNSLVDSIQISPSAPSVAAGSTAQFTATGVIGHGSHPSSSQDVTDQVTWSSGTPAVATINASGLATGVSAGTATITAQMNGFNGVISATDTLTVTSSGSGGSGGSGGGAQEPLLSINVVPSGTTVSNKGMTGQYLAFGTFATVPTVRDVTNQVTWISLLPEVASINSYGAAGAAGSGGSSGELAGLATAQGYTGTTDIYAEATNPDGTVVLSNSQTFTCQDPNDNNLCNPAVATPQFATITVFIEGENTSPTGEYVTAPTDTGTPNLIHCGPDWTGSGGQVCTGTYAVGSTVKVLENLPAGSSYFGGWSTGSGCAEAGFPVNLSILATSTTCTVTLSGNASVGVIFY